MNKDLLTKNRIWIIGGPGSGKTYLSKQISLNRDITHIELDQLFWLPHWQRESDSNLQHKVAQISNQDSWIIDGVYIQVGEILSARANLVIWLDLPLIILLIRTIKRAVNNLLYKKVFCNGNRESFKRLFTRESIVFFVINSYQENKENYKKIFDSLKAKNSDTCIVHVKNNEDYKKLSKIFGVYNEKS